MRPHVPDDGRARSGVAGQDGDTGHGVGDGVLAEVEIYHFTAQAGDVIYTPAGYLTGVTINNRQHAYGFRQSILPKLPDAQTAQQITSLSAMQKAIQADNDMVDDQLVLNTVVSFLEVLSTKSAIPSVEPAAKKARTTK